MILNIMQTDIKHSKLNILIEVFGVVLDKVFLFYFVVVVDFPVLLSGVGFVLGIAVSGLEIFEIFKHVVLDSAKEVSKMVEAVLSNYMDTFLVKKIIGFF